MSVGKARIRSRRWLAASVRLKQAEGVCSSNGVADMPACSAQSTASAVRGRRLSFRVPNCREKQRSWRCKTFSGQKHRFSQQSAGGTGTGTGPGTGPAKTDAS